MRQYFYGLLALLFISPSYAEVKGYELEYKEGNTVMRGYLAYDNAIMGIRPGVLVVHEWWGHNEYARTRARMLAKLGYTALAVDMYGDGKQADHPDDAGKFSSQIANNMPLGEARFMAALGKLKKHYSVDPSRIAAIGYCFGGGVVLHMARQGADLKGVVSFHGSLSTKTPAEPGRVKAKVMVNHGADDPFVPVEEIEGFKKEMEAAKVNYVFNAYPGAKHSFTNPGADQFGKKFNLPLEYDQEADEASWKAMQEFFKTIFK